MKLSMWILADWLKKYNPQVKIKEGKRNLRNVRLLSYSVNMDSMDVYMGSMKDFAGDDSNQVICVQGHDMIILDTEDSQQVFNEILDAFDYYNSWSDRLQEMVRHGASLQELLDESYEIFQNTLLIADPGYLITAHTSLEKFPRNKNVDAMKATGIMPLKTILSINDDPRIRKKNPYSYVMDYEELGEPCLCRNLFSRNTHIGWALCIVTNAPITYGLLQLLDELGSIIEYWSDLHHDQLQLLSYTDIFQKLLSGDEIDPAQQTTRLRSIGWYPEDEKQIYILNKTEENTRILEHFQRKLERLANGCFSIMHHGKPTLIINKRIVFQQDFKESLEDFMQQTGTYCGISPEFTDIFKLQEYVNLAEIASTYGDQTPGSINFFESYAIPYAAEILRKYANPGIVHPALGILKEYDDTNHTDLFHTLCEYLDCEQNYVKTAANLYIHRNSLLYRLKRIRELTNIDFDNPDTCLHLQISYRL